MFIWQKAMERLDIAPSSVRRLYRSLGDLQIALPGFPAQHATAYLCVFAVEGGFRVVVALHLLISHRLAFYLDEQGPVQKQDVGRVLNEGIFFAESMGFMLGDLDFQLLGPTERAALWDSLPLQRGSFEPLAAASPAEVTPAEVTPAEVTPAEVTPAEVTPAEVTPAEVTPAEVTPAEATPAEATPTEATPTEATEEPVSPPVPVGEPKTGRPLRPSVFIGKRPPTAEELAVKRKKLLESLGRFLASF